MNANKVKKLYTHTHTHTHTHTPFITPHTHTHTHKKTWDRFMEIEGGAAGAVGWEGKWTGERGGEEGRRYASLSCSELKWMSDPFSFGEETWTEDLLGSLRAPRRCFAAARFSRWWGEVGGGEREGG